MAIKVSGTEVISDDKRILNNEDLPDIRPSLLLDFANSKTLDPRITFTRGSTATYWDGKTTAKAEENLLTYSQDWTHLSWAKTGVSVTVDNTTAPDGTNTADKLEITTEGTYRNTSKYPSGVASTQYTASCYLKAGNHNYVAVQIQSRDSGGYISSAAFQSIDLSDGSTVGNTTGTYLISDIGNGWYRLSVTGTLANNATVAYMDILFVNSSGSGAPGTPIASGSNLYAWGAQLEQRSSATAYTPTTSSPIVKYQPVLQTAASGEARFDHDPVTGESKGLLIEEARTNLHPNSNANWSTPVGGTLSYNQIVSPVGNTDGILLQATASTGNHVVPRTINFTSGETYTGSIFIKKGTERYVHVSAGNNNTWNAGARFDLDTGTVSYTQYGSATITDVGNGWYRCEITGVSYATAATNFNIWLIDQSTFSTTFTAAGTETVYLFGAQLEEGSFPTSYIPTSGSTVTRSADLPLMSGSNFTDWFNDLPFSAYVEYDFQTSAINQRLFSIDTGGYDPRFVLLGSVSNGYGPALDLVSSGDNTIFITSDATTPTEAGNHKIALAVTDNDAAISKDGAAVATDTSFVFPSNFSQLRIGSQANGANLMQGTIKKIAFYPKRLPNATLQAMTEE